MCFGRSAEDSYYIGLFKRKARDVDELRTKRRLLEEGYVDEMRDYYGEPSEEEQVDD